MKHAQACHVFIPKENDLFLMIEQAAEQVFTAVMHIDIHILCREDLIPGMNRAKGDQVLIFAGQSGDPPGKSQSTFFLRFSGHKTA